MRKPKLSFKNKPVYHQGNFVILKETGKQVRIVSAKDNRDMSNQFRQDFKDGLEYGIIDHEGNAGLYNWWDFEIPTTKDMNSISGITKTTPMSVSEALLSLPYSQEVKLINAIEKMMRKRHEDWVKSFMVDRNAEDVGSIPYLSINGSGMFIEQMISELKKGE